MSIEGQGHLHLKIKTGFSQKPLGQLKPNFICKLSGTKKWKFIDRMVVALPRWPPCPYMVKPFKNLPLRNRWTDFHETWYFSSVTPAHYNLFKWWPQVDLDLFYGKVKFGNISLSIGKSENLIFQNFCSLWPETNWDNEDMWVLKVKVISWPWPKVIYIWKLKLAFLRNDWANLNQILFCAWPKYQVSVSQDH